MHSSSYWTAKFLLQLVGSVCGCDISCLNKIADKILRPQPKLKNFGKFPNPFRDFESFAGSVDWFPFVFEENYFRGILTE